MIKAILFDLDGVLIETEKETFRFYQDYLKKHHNIILKDSDFKYKAGRKSVDFWNAILTQEQQAEVDTKKLTTLKREMFNAEPQNFIKKMEGVKDLLEMLKKNDFKLALVSQNESRMIDTAINWLDAREYFDILLSIDEITNLKPDPEIYLLAAKKLGVKPEECIVVEDSKDGVGSAKNAQMKCIGMEHEYTPPGNLDLADTKVDQLNQITLELIQSL